LAHFVTDIEEEVFEYELVQFVGYNKQYPTEAVSSPACLRHMRESRIMIWSISKRRHCVQTLFDISRC